MKIAVLALQGAFIEHEQRLQQLGAETFEVRQLADWLQPMDGLVLPGGESTVQMRLLDQLLCWHDSSVQRVFGHDEHPGAP